MTGNLVKVASVGKCGQVWKGAQVKHAHERCGDCGLQQALESLGICLWWNKVGQSLAYGFSAPIGLLYDRYGVPVAAVRHSLHEKWRTIYLEHLFEFSFFFGFLSPLVCRSLLLCFFCFSALLLLCCSASLPFCFYASPLFLLLCFLLLCIYSCFCVFPSTILCLLFPACFASLLCCFSVFLFFVSLLLFYALYLFCFRCFRFSTCFLAILLITSSATTTLRTAPTAQTTIAANTEGATRTTSATKATRTTRTAREWTLQRQTRNTIEIVSCFLGARRCALQRLPPCPLQLFLLCCCVLSLLPVLVSFRWCKDYDANDLLEVSQCFNY